MRLDVSSGLRWNFEEFGSNTIARVNLLMNEKAKSKSFLLPFLLYWLPQEGVAQT